MTYLHNIFKVYAVLRGYVSKFDFICRSFRMFRKVLTGTGTLLMAAVPLSTKDDKKKAAKEDEELKYRPQDLPIYSTVQDKLK